VVSPQSAKKSMPKHEAVNDNASVTRFILDRAKAPGACASADWRGVGWKQGRSDCGNRGDEGKRGSWRSPTTESQSRRAKAGAAGHGLLPIARSSVIDHSEDVSLAAGAVMREGTYDADGVARMPAARSRLRGAGFAVGGVDGGAAACSASFGEGARWAGAVGEVARAARELRSYSASLHADR